MPTSNNLHGEVIEEFKNQIIITLFKRLKNKYKDDLVIPTSEIDDTDQDLLTFRINENLAFEFKLRKKS